MNFTFKVWFFMHYSGHIVKNESFKTEECLSTFLWCCTLQIYLWSILNWGWLCKRIYFHTNDLLFFTQTEAFILQELLFSPREIFFLSIWLCIHSQLLKESGKLKIDCTFKNTFIWNLCTWLVIDLKIFIDKWHRAEKNNNVI